MTTKLYQTRVSFDVVLEASDLEDANRIIDDFIDNLTHAPETNGVAVWDGVQWDDPTTVCSDCGEEKDDFLCPEMSTLCTLCCEHNEHKGLVLYEA